MPINNEISEKKKALLAFKEKILDDIKYCERSIDDVRATIKNNNFYYDHADSSDSEDDFPSAVDMGPSITQLKLQQSMMKTCLHATQELTSLTILQSEVDVLVEEPKFEGEPPVTEPGTWREVIAECRIDLVPFTMTFFMHTPDRKFGPHSYRGLRVVPVKPAHELELSKSVLSSLKIPSDAVEVLRSYAAGYRSRRTTLARLVNKYNNALFMEPHSEGGFVMKCADLLEVSWRLENKWSPVAPFHHRMKFDLEFMEESYIKIITQTHKQLLDPTLQTDERTLLLAKIITTCLEARGPIDPESDLESKTTERDNDIDKIESENEKRDSEVMAPPKSLPKKSKQKSKEANTAQKRTIDDENPDSGAKKMRNDEPEPKKSIAEANNPRKSKTTEVATETAKKRKISEVNKVANAKNDKETVDTQDNNVNSKDNNKENQTSNSKPKNVKEAENNAKSKNLKESDDRTANTNTKPKNMKESVPNEDKNAKTKNKVTKEGGDIASKEMNPKPKNIKEATKVLKEPANIDSNANKPKLKIVKETDKNQEKHDREIPIQNNTKDVDRHKDTATKKNTNKELNTEKDKNKVKNVTTKETANTDKNNQINKAKNITSKETAYTEKSKQNENSEKNKNIDKKKLKTVVNTKSKDNIDVNKDAERPINKNSEKITEGNAKIHSKPKNIDTAKAKNFANMKNDGQTTKKAPELKTNVASTKNDAQPKKVTEKKVTKEKVTDIANKPTDKNIKGKTSIPNVKNVTQTVKKVMEKNAINIRNQDKIINKIAEKKDKSVAMKEIPQKVFSSNVLTKKTKDPTMSTKNIVKNPIIPKLPSHRNSLKPQNPPKIIKAGNTKAISTGNTEKENGGKGSKIPQKKLSIISEGSSKKNMLRISPRIMSSKFKTTSQNMMKITNIPRLLKKPVPKAT